MSDFTPKILHSDLIWQGTSWRLRVDEVTLPNNTAVKRGIIEHPGSVVLVPLQTTSKGYEVIMIRQYRLALQKKILELPAGTRNEGEPWLTCAQRELREETGHRADSFHPLGTIWPTPGSSDEVMTIYLARGLSPAPLPRDVDELIEHQPMPLTKLIDMALDGRLQDAKSVVALLRTAQYLKLPMG